MQDTLFPKISRGSSRTIIDYWQTNQTGAIVELHNNVFYFVDYLNDKGILREKHLSEEAELSCPIVAVGFVAYWLKMYDSIGVKEIFDNYFALCLRTYELEHQSDADAWERDLVEEFTCRWHLSAEKKYMKDSEAIYPFLTSSDVARIKEINASYLRYVRKKRLPYTQKVYAKNRIIEDTFFEAYKSGGAYMCVDWVRTEYDLPYMTNPYGKRRKLKDALQGRWRIRHEVELPEYIQEAYDDFNDEVLVCRDGGLIEEIEDNLKRCVSQDDKVRYIISLLYPFKEFADAFYPLARIEERKKAIQVTAQALNDWKKVPKEAVDERTGKLLMPEKQIEACHDMISRYEQDIEYWKYVEDRFYSFAQSGLKGEFEEGDNPEIFKCLGEWWGLMITFSRRLAALALSYGIKLIDVQKQCGIHLNWSYSIIDYVDDKYVLSIEHAQKLLNDIESKEKSEADSMTESVIKDIIQAGQSMERLPSLYRGKDEEGMRDVMVNALSLKYGDATVTPETYNRLGKTDILIRRASDSRNLCIVECKIWKGPKYHKNAIDQLFGRYLTWHDSNVALVIFVLGKNMTRVLNLIQKETCQHKYYVQCLGKSSESTISYIFSHPNDQSKKISFEIIALNFDKIDEN